MSMFALMREYPWVKRYWYVGLGIVFLVAVALIVLDGYTQVNKSRRAAERKAQRQKRQVLTQQIAEEGQALSTRTANATPPSFSSPPTVSSDADLVYRSKRGRTIE